MIFLAIGVDVLICCSLFIFENQQSQRLFGNLMGHLAKAGQEFAKEKDTVVVWNEYHIFMHLC